MRDTFALSLKLPEDAAGKTLVFPVVQVCQEGENAWVQEPAAGQDAHSLDFPAPTVNVVAATDDAHGTPSASPSAEAPAEPSTSATPVAEVPLAAASSSDSSKGLAVTGLIAGIAGIAVGGFALATRRR